MPTGLSVRAPPIALARPGPALLALLAGLATAGCASAGPPRHATEPTEPTEPAGAATPPRQPASAPPAPFPLGPAVDPALARQVAAMTLEQKVAQLVIAYPPTGDAPFDQGGVILVGKMLRDPEALKVRVESLRRRARTPLLVTVDLEGGELNRLKGVATMAAFPTAREMGEEGPWEAEAWGRRAGLDLKSLGVNVSLGPVLDLADRGFMAETGRSLGADPARVSRLARSFARGLASAGILTVGKHYPGYGPVEGSSDKALLVIDRSAQEIARHQAAFVNAADVLAAVMLANVGFTAYGGVPAILSPELVARAHLSGFVTVTDDLSVPSLLAVTGGDAAELWRRAFLAGNDLLLTTAPCSWNGRPDPRVVLAVLLRERPDLLPDLDLRVGRVLALKARAGLLALP